jgi:hypothetical protein
MRVHCRSGFLGISRFNTKSDSPMLVQKILQEACVPPDHLPPGLSEHLGMRQQHGCRDEESDPIVGCLGNGQVKIEFVLKLLATRSDVRLHLIEDLKEAPDVLLGCMLGRELRVAGLKFLARLDHIE